MSSMNNINNMNEYITHDYHICTVLLASDLQLVAHRYEGGKILWTFKEVPEIAEVLAKHYNGTLILPTNKVFSAQRLLKNQINQFNNPSL